MHPFIRQWPLELILGQLGSTGARGCGGRRLWSAPSQRETIAVIAMEITATPPTTPPTISPVFELLPPVDEGLERAEGESPIVNDTAKLVGGDWVPVTVAATVPVTAPEGPSNAPGDISGVSIKQDVGETLMVGEKNRDDSHHQLHATDWSSKRSRPGRCCEYVAMENNNRNELRRRGEPIGGCVSLKGQCWGTCGPFAPSSMPTQYFLLRGNSRSKRQSLRAVRCVI